VDGVTLKPVLRMNKAQEVLSLTGDALSAIETQSELWEETYESLKRSDGQVLQALDFKDSSIQDLNNALDAATKAQKSSQEKERKVAFRGREFKIYDVFSNVVGS
jgi:hypothetical protein